MLSHVACVILSHYLTHWLELYGGASTLTLIFRQKSTNMAISGPLRFGYAGSDDKVWYSISHIKQPFPTHENVQVWDWW